MRIEVSFILSLRGLYKLCMLVHRHIKYAYMGMYLKEKEQHIVGKIYHSKKFFKIY